MLEASVCESTERRDNLAALLFRGQRDEQWVCLQKEVETDTIVSC